MGLRWDKYEKKPKYWYEEDLEMEWEKIEARHISQEGSFEMESNFDKFAMDHAAPIQVDMGAATAGLAQFPVITIEHIQCVSALSRRTMCHACRT